MDGWGGWGVDCPKDDRGRALAPAQHSVSGCWFSSCCLQACGGPPVPSPGWSLSLSGLGLHPRLPQPGLS